MAKILEMKGVTKEYKGVPVLRNVDFDMEEAEIHALVGENGAGKSTLTKILAGAVTPTKGKIILLKVASVSQPLPCGRQRSLQDRCMMTWL